MQKASGFLFLCISGWALGLRFEPDDPERDLLREARTKLASMLLESLTTGEAAIRLSMPESEILHMERARRVYSLNHEYGVMRFPLFQFTPTRLVPGFEQVAPYIPIAQTLTVVVDWFSMKDPDLRLERDERSTPWCPKVWLMAEHDPKRVIECARTLAITY